MRRGKLGVCTRRMNEVKALLAEGCDVESIKRSAEIFFYVTFLVIIEPLLA